ncbi:MAG: hypothetical protein AAB348_01850 [Patescibacteria group bacterium]
MISPKYRPIILGMLAIGAFLFFWYQIRPGIIRSKCSKINNGEVEYIFKNCIRKHGLEE